VKNELARLATKGLPTQQICDSYGRDAVKEKRKLYNFRQRIRSRGPNIDTWQDLLRCENDAVPEDPDTMFAVAHDIRCNEVEQVVRVFLSTTKLLATTALGERIHADGTYKLIWQGFPVIVVGTTDARRSFVLGGLAICSGETVEDYQFAFDTMAQYYRQQKTTFSFK
jgi:hypothetical protein